MTDECHHGHHETCSGAGWDWIESFPMPCPCECHDGATPAPHRPRVTPMVMPRRRPVVL